VCCDGDRSLCRDGVALNLTEFLVRPRTVPFCCQTALFGFTEYLLKPLGHLTASGHCHDHMKIFAHTTSELGKPSLPERMCGHSHPGQASCQITKDYLDHTSMQTRLTYILKPEW